VRLLEPLTPDPRAALARAHPLAKIAAALVLMLALFLTIDPITPTLVLAFEIAAVRLIGIPPRALLRRALPVLVAAIGIGFFNALLSGNVAGGIAIGIRLVGIALAGIVAIASIDPTDLADALVEHLHAPQRFTVGALAAFRLMPLFADEWETIALARRARGLDDARGPLSRVTGFFAMTRSLLVATIRRATRLALAMDGRGFAARGSPCRTLARPRPIVARDWALIAASIAVAALASALSVALGSWRFFLAR
jgi:energy-coupling factor transport system permease protein